MRIALQIGAAVLCLVGSSVAQAQVTVQDSGDVIGSGDDAWSYMILEGEDYDSELNDGEGVGFVKVDSSGTLTSFLENPILGADTTASNGGALYTQSPAFGPHSDQATYQVQFARPGTYYLYMRFTMFENGGNLAHYINEDSFFVPPNFNADPSTDWPLMTANGHNGGYTEGCCELGYLTIIEDGVPVNRRNGGEEGQAYWEGNFHWNQLLSSQFLDPVTQGERSVRYSYEVTEAQVGQVMDWTIAYRESGTTIDLFLFSTEADLMNRYTQEELDQILLGISSPSDLNGDTRVDAADAGLMFSNWGMTGVGDINTDNVVDAADAGIMFADWTGDAAGAQAVPEPTGLIWMGLALAGWATTRRRD